MIRYDRNIQYVTFILDNLRDEDLEELQALWGNKWRENVINNALKTNFMVLFGIDEAGNNIPIAFGGFAELFEQKPEIACVWLLCSKYINNNKRLLLKTLKSQIHAASLRYRILYNYIYNSNYKAKKMLKMFGFNFDNPKPKELNVAENFEFFYKLNL